MVEIPAALTEPDDAEVGVGANGTDDEDVVSDESSLLVEVTFKAPWLAVEVATDELPCEDAVE